MRKQNNILIVNTKRFYGRRKGKALTKSMQQRFDNVLPNVSVTLNTNTPNVSLKNIFNTAVDDVWLEVGFGGGEHLSWQAQNNPNIGFIGCDPFINGIAKILRDIDTHNLQNIRLYTDDACHIIDACPDAYIGRLFALFTDPWPKYRHRHRRFISPDNLDRFARILQDGAMLRIATDHPIYLQWILKHTPVHQDFEWLDANRNDWLNRPKDWPTTRYEMKAIQQNRTPHFLTFKRKNRK